MDTFDDFDEERSYFEDSHFATLGRLKQGRTVQRVENLSYICNSTSSLPNVLGHRVSLAPIVGSCDGLLVAA